MKAREDMKMIIGTIDSIEVAITIFQDTPNVTEEVLAAVRPQDRLTILRREDDVITNLGVG